ncbi:MAG: ferrochelatase [Alphaproteobacteria bacterium]|nr:ferrochelatase [Alphaproteobacteria bacterium]
MAPKKIAVVLFNLGGPDTPAAVRPFLFNLFNDPDILEKPWPVRLFLAALISSLRAPKARKIYAHLGGGSPLLANTKSQADALSRLLSEESSEYRVFIAMRYWNPRSDEAAQQVRDFDPDRIILLPLYPQFSKTTTGSSSRDWARAARKAGLDTPTTTICCYPTAPGMVTAQAARITEVLCDLGRGPESGDGRNPPPRVLFSAHGLPKHIVAGGDPYQWQVEQTAAAIVAELKNAAETPPFDSALCYQSRVGPLEWIGPSTMEEIARAGEDKAPVILLPIAFVSEHSETLVELDIEYRQFAEQQGVETYIRLPALATAELFMVALKELVISAATTDDPVCSREGPRLCPQGLIHCPR